MGLWQTTFLYNILYNIDRALEPDNAMFSSNMYDSLCRDSHSDVLKGGEREEEDKKLFNEFN